MLPRVIDADQMQRACGIDASAFMQYALAGAIPPALGLYNGKPVWAESAGRDLAARTGSQFSVEAIGAESAPVLVLPAAVVEAPAAAVADASHDDSWPDEMPQGMAADYLGVSAGWLVKQSKEGVIGGHKSGLFMIYTRADLDTLKTLPVYRYRKRNGFSHGQPIKHAEKTPAPTVAGDEDYIGETAAADFLNMPRETLALARNGGSGPTCVYSNGSPKYRVADLKAWQEKNGTQRKVAKCIRSTDRNMDTHAAAEYLGLTHKQLQNLFVHVGKKKPPACDRREMPGGGRARYMFSAQDLETWKNENGERLSGLQRMREIGLASRTRQLAAKTAKRGPGRPRRVPLEKGPAKAGTSTRKSLNGQPMRA